MKKWLKKIFSYFKESRDELSKVVWPTRARVVEMTITVLVLVIIVAIFLGVFDYIFSKMLTFMISLRK